MATEPCALPRLSDDPTVADLEIGYGRRGAALAACDTARQLAVDTLTAERAAIDAWLEDRRDRARRRGWWPF